VTTPAPRKIWIVFDDLDGPHVFESLEKAKKTLKQMRREFGMYPDFREKVRGPVGYSRDTPLPPKRRGFRL
jgi:hypothetical protein